MLLINIIIFWLLLSIVTHSFRSIKKISFQHQHILYSYNNDYNVAYLERMVERKKIEVESLLRRHQSTDDPIVMRMSYIASECK